MSPNIRVVVARATKTIVPLWPLSSFIAVNPLGGHEAQQFEDIAVFRPRAAFLADYRAGRITENDLIAAVLERVPELAGAETVTVGDVTRSPARLIAMEMLHRHNSSDSPGDRRGDKVDELTSKWLAAFVDPHPLWPMPNRDDGFWSAWKSLARHDPQLRLSARRRLRQLPEGAEEALELALARLGVPPASAEVILRQEAEYSPGWVAHVKWRAEHYADIDLTSYLAVRLTTRWALDLPAPYPSVVPTPEKSHNIRERVDQLLRWIADETPAPDVHARVARILAVHPLALHNATWQNAYEQHYRQPLIQSISCSDHESSQPTVQVVMCIDPRSEGMRRLLEVDPMIDTYGFAGFFGIPIRFARHGARSGIDSLPALLTPRHTVTEIPRDHQKAARRVAALRVRDAVAAGLHAGESVPAAPFALAETLGWFYGAATLARTVAPATTARASETLRSYLTPQSDTEVGVADAFTVEERVALAENVIRMMGLNRFAKLVVLTGHGSTSANNLYQSALDCGACGGNPGAANARAAAAIFNDPAVRAGLAARGLEIPHDTFFLAAEHNTVADQIRALDPHLIPGTHTDIVTTFLAAQKTAGDALVLERANQLPGARGHKVSRLRARAQAWAEVYPELGLAGNAAMIIGPRGMTREVDLQRRVFLHSYRSELDPDGSALETIMTAPLVVAQWINHQYYFSTVTPNRWGSGTKTVHNAIGTLGVISGQTGDLRLGLPLQSVAVGDTALHEPLRLSVVIQAPLERIGVIISQNQVLRNLFENDWITLTARNTAGAPWRRYGTYGWAEVPNTIKGV